MMPTNTHPGAKRFLCHIRKRFVYKDMRRDVAECDKKCKDSQKSKFHRHEKMKLGNYLFPKCLFIDINLDIVEFLLPSNGF